MNFPEHYASSYFTRLGYPLYLPALNPYFPPYLPMYAPGPYDPNEYPYMGLEPPVIENNQLASEIQQPTPKQNLTIETDKKNEHISQSSKEINQQVKQQYNNSQSQSHDSVPNIKIKIEQSEHININETPCLKRQTSNLFNVFHHNPDKYQSTLHQLLNKGSIQSSIFKVIDLKIKTFKKSKQQMIKIIIRRTQRHYKFSNKCKKDERFRKYGGFKSMNTIYLQNMFSDPLFLKAYEEVAFQFKQQMQNQNLSKLQCLCQHLNQPKNGNDFANSLMVLLSQKNKMPWPSFWMQKMHKTIYQLYDTYGDRKPQIAAKLKSNIENHSLYKTH